MDNTTTSVPYWFENLTEGSLNASPTSTIINLYLTNATDSSTLDVHNNTLANSTTSPLLPVEEKTSLAALWTYSAVRILSGIMAVFGNSLTIFAVTKFERLQTCTNYLICSLAFSDIVAGLMTPLVLVHEFNPRTSFFIPVCLTQQLMALIAAGGSLLGILYLSIDRYIYIAYALRYQTLVTPRRLAIILTITWINMFISVPTIIFTANHLQVGMPCRYHIFLNPKVQLLYMYPQTILIFALTVGFHLAIAKIAHRQARQIQAQQQPYNTLEVAINQSTKRIGCTLGLVLGVYVGSIIPRIVLAGIGTKIKAVESYSFVTIALYWSSACVNPLIYAWRLKDFKIAFKKIFTGTGTFIEVPGMPA